MLIAILALVLLFTIAIAVVVSRRHKVVQQSQPGGVALRKAAENIPIYGTFVKVAGVVGKPVNNVLDKFTGYQVKALQHIPVVGTYVAKPLEVTQNTVKKLNNWLGL
jgi:hypothetical protein